MSRKISLSSRRQGSPRSRPIHLQKTELFLKDLEAQISFVKNGEGRVTQLILHQGGIDTTALKVK
jgi:hypothetical protein